MSANPHLTASDPAQLIRILKGTPAPGPESNELAELRAEVVQLRQENTLLAPLRAENKRLKRALAREQAETETVIRLLENGHFTPSQKTGLVRVGRLALEKKEKVGTDPNGNVRISPSELANDRRKADTKGQYNADGSRIVMARRNVPALLEGLRHIAPLDYVNVSAGRDPVTGYPYMDDILLEPPESLHDFLKPFAWFAPPEQANRKDRTTKPKPTPCPHCHEIHDYNVTTTCTGCEKVVAERTIDRTTPPADAEGPMSHTLCDNSIKEPMSHTLCDPPLDPWDIPHQEASPRPTRAPSPTRTHPDEPWLTRGAYVMRNGTFERAGDDRHTGAGSPQ